LSAEDQQQKRLREQAELLHRREEERCLGEERQRLADLDREHRESAIRNQDRANAERREDLLRMQKKDLAERLRLIDEEKKRAAVFKQTERLKREQQRKVEEKKRRDRHEEALAKATGRSQEELTPRPKTVGGSRRSRLDPNLGALPIFRGRGASKDSRSVRGTGCLLIWGLPLTGALWMAWSRLW
jgi:hypothetical protein